MKRVRRPFWKTLKKIIFDFRPDVIATYSASASWFIILSFFPFIIMLLAMIQFLPYSSEDLSFINMEFIPEIIRQLLQKIISELLHTNQIILPVATFTGLLSASTGFYSLIKGLNVIYKRKETRSALAVRAMCLLYTVLFLVILIAVLTSLVFGRAIYHGVLEMFPFFSDTVLTVINWRFLVALIVLTLFFTLLYKTVPDRKARWFGEIPGALVAAAMWMAFSYLYSLYISNFNRFSAIYGSLTAVILFMIWLYSCIYIIFIGAYVNVLLQKTGASIILKKPTK